MQGIDFLKLMGKGKRCWKHVKTGEHHKQLAEFKGLFEKNYRAPGNEIIIPEILHFVWLGPKPYPEQSKRYLEGWKERHPGWQVHVWHDGNVDLGDYRDLYESSDNFGERSDIVRLLVLERMGGLYVDHDMECRRSFAEFHRSYSLYGGLLTPGNPVIDRAAIVRNSIIGVIPHHPVIQRALEKMREKWWHDYPGNDVWAVKRRVTLRSFAAFHESVLEHKVGMFFPAGCFNEIDKKFGIFAREDMVGAWYTEGMTHHEEYLKERLHKLMKRLNLFMILTSVAIGILFVCVFFL